MTVLLEQSCVSGFKHIVTATGDTKGASANADLPVSEIKPSSADCQQGLFPSVREGTGTVEIQHFLLLMVFIPRLFPSCASLTRS